MYEMHASARTVAKEWMTKVEEGAEEYKRLHPRWEEELLNRTKVVEEATSEAAGGLSAAGAEPDSDDEATPIQQRLELELGELIEKMRDNLDNNRKIMTEVEKLLTEAGVEFPETLVVTASSLKRSGKRRSDRFNRRAARRPVHRRKPSTLKRNANLAPGGGEGGGGRGRLHVRPQLNFTKQTNALT